MKINRCIFHHLIAGLCVMWLCISCQREKSPVVVLFDNDVHCSLRVYEQMAYMRDSVEAQGEDVIVTSSGDFVQGDIAGSVSNGQYIVDLMNHVPYDVLTIGNHEFDYGLNLQHSLMERLKAEVVCCNLSLADGTPCYPPLTIRACHGIKIAFVGVTTPSVFTSSCPILFQDTAGNMLYDFHEDDTFARIQQAVDEAREKGAQYVIVLSHLGDDTYVARSTDMIAATHGIDVVLDGHSHHYLDTCMTNNQGEMVTLLSTGANGSYIGMLHITDEGITHRMLPQRENVSPNRVSVAIDSIESALEKTVGKVIGYSEVCMRDKDDEGNRLVRNSETNLSDLVADALRHATHAEIGLIHGGSLRHALPEGEITVADVMAVLPFNNQVAKVRMTGQQLLDAMEVSVAQWPEENGDFHIASGLRYTLDANHSSSLLLDANHLFVGVGNQRRIVCMEVEDSVTHRWTAINPTRTYTIGGLNYSLLNLGASGMFRYAEAMPIPMKKDVDALMEYIHFLGDTIRQTMYPYPIVSPRFEVVR